MKNSSTKIRVSHCGRLPTPVGFEEVSRRLALGEVSDGEVAEKVVPVVAGVVKRQAQIGIDTLGDGEFWSMLASKWYGQQMSGLSSRPLKAGEVAAMRESTRERDVFTTLYADMDRVGTIACIPGERPIPAQKERIIVSGPVKSKGTAATERQIACFRAAIAQSGVTPDETFVPALAPGWLDHFIYNEHYKTDEEFVFALADAMSDKYHAIADAGFVLQLDDPGIATSWDMLKPEPGMADYRKYIAVRIEALNHALKGIRPEQVRYHFCWGSWHGAHVNDIPLRHIVDLALQVNAQTISFEAANVRHEHEIEVWKEQKLAPGRMLMPGVISHATNIVEHPELVARRLGEYAAFAGRENVIAGADCGMGGRVHAEIGWAKLQALAEGAALASKSLWRR